MTILDTIRPHWEIAQQRLDFRFQQIIERLDRLDQTVRDSGSDPTLSDRMLRVQLANFTGTQIVQPNPIPPGEIWIVDIFTSSSATGALIQTDPSATITLATLLNAQSIVTNPLVLPAGFSGLALNVSASAFMYLQITRHYLHGPRHRADIGNSKEYTAGVIGAYHEGERDRVDYAATIPRHVTVVE